MNHITLTFAPLAGRLDGRFVTARGLHGLVFNVLRKCDVNEATWLHSHPSPKPFSLVVFYTEEGDLAGLRLGAVNKRATRLLKDSWDQVWHARYPLRLGQQEFLVRGVTSTPGPTFGTLASTKPASEMALQFLSPTAFKQGPGSLPLPLPVNVFSWPVRVWQAFAPTELALPEDWLAWCERNVFVTGHRIETVSVAISQGESFTGFVGEVQFEAKDDSELYLSVWQALGELAAFCGVGQKTTMGMGAVEKG
ncbi:MAG: CRISPR system precrRNA processing endoribonuclease RAMP protein Cas6 [Chloroflexi bacterium]|nr:CRISPR system precrRNA processing endoribonuclease RAMP protein Cas6 [Chloroflexota bacterium]